MSITKVAINDIDKYISDILDATVFDIVDQLMDCYGIKDGHILPGGHIVHASFQHEGSDQKWLLVKAIDGTLWEVWDSPNGGNNDILLLAIGAIPLQAKE